MQTTDRDYADKSWLTEDEDAFVILTPFDAAVALVCVLILGYLLGLVKP